ncbi:MAG: protein involved in polysaccharide export, contains domain of the beta-grasp fold [Fibrobacteres bacterium]|nr:protein involved in polysaccharide export, contains domain of the beta-grasp fold [Fibrobacterota bacterium]
MTITCRRPSRLFPWLLLLPILGAGQSLEDKVSQARKQQALSSTEGDQADSILSERKSRGIPSTLGKPKRADQGDRAGMDSLLSSPQDTAANQAAYGDTVGGRGRKKISRGGDLPKRYEQRIFQNVDRSAFSSAGGAAGRNYILGPGDEITVSMWGDKEKEYSLLVNKDGKIFLEGIGVVPMAGNTVDQAGQILKQRLAKVYSGISRGTAHVEVALGKVGPIRVFVLGEVKVPGGYVFTGHTSVLSALYYARGPTDIGTVRNMTLTRSGSRFNLDLYKYLMHGENLTPDALQDGDIIFAGRAEALVEIDGDVGRAATYELKKGEGVKELLEFAGGLNVTAASHKLTLQRVFEDGKLDIQDLAAPQEYLSGKAKIELRDGDRIMVEKSTETSRNFITVSGPVKYPGAYEATGINTVPQLVAKAGGLREDAYLGRVHVVRFKPEGSSSLMAYSLDSTDVETIRLMPKDNVILYSIKDMYLPDSVQISGAIFNPARYEFREGISVKDLVMQAGGFLPHHESGRVIIFRGNTRERKVEQITLDIDDGLAKSGPGFLLKANDFVQVPIDPRWYKKEIVTLDGLFMHPGKYALLFPGEKLASVVERAGGFKDDGYVRGGRFFRSKDSVGRVGVDLKRAVESPRSKANISLMGGDSIFVPERLNTVKVVGEVGFETSVLIQEGAAVQYYIEKAGGFTRRSEKDRVVVQYANGETSRDGYFNRKPDAGSVIYVPQGPEPQPFNWATNINFLLGTLTAGITLIILANQVSK